MAWGPPPLDEHICSVLDWLIKLTNSKSKDADLPWEWRLNDCRRIRQFLQSCSYLWLIFLLLSGSLIPHFCSSQDGKDSLEECSYTNRWKIRLNIGGNPVWEKCNVNSYIAFARHRVKLKANVTYLGIKIDMCRLYMLKVGLLLSMFVRESFTLCWKLKVI